MFGLFYAIGTGIATIISGIKCSIENENGLQDGINRYKNGQNFEYTYFDRKGVKRDIETGKIADVRADINDPSDDKYLWLGAPSIRTRNISEEKRKYEFQLGKQGDWLGQTVDVYDKRFWATTGNNKHKTIIHGIFYKDLVNEKLYVCREFPLSYDVATNKFSLWKSNGKKYICKFYMDICTGLLVRKADTQIDNQDDFLSEMQINEFINQFNKMQKKGGWYKGGYKYNGAEDDILEKQNFYCNDFDAIDHFKKLIEIRENHKAEANIELYNEIGKYK